MIEQPHMFMEKVYLFKPNYDPDTLLHIRNAGMLMKNPNYYHERCMPDTLFEYIFDGEGYISYDGVTHTLKNGDFVIARVDIGRGKCLSYGSNKDNPYNKFWFTADGRFIREILDAFGVKEPITIIRRNVFELFQSFILGLGDGEDTMKNISALTALLYTTFNGKKDHSKENDFDAKVTAYLENNMQLSPSLTEAATDLGLDKRSFANYFRKRFNMSYKCYMRKKRLVYAQMMLRDEKNTITEVANHLSFCDQSYFSHCFYEEFGVYPSEYRKQYFSKGR